MKKAIISILAFALVLTGIMPQSALSVERTPSTEAQGEWIRIVAETPVASVDGASELGRLQEDSIWLAEIREDSNAYIQWGDEWAVVDRARVETIDPQSPEVKDLANWPEQGQAVGNLVTGPQADVRDADGQIIAQLSEAITYPYIQYDEGKYAIVLGGRLGYIASSDVKEAVADERPGENAPDENLDQPNQEVPSAATPLEKPSTATLTAAATFGKYFKVTVDNLIVYDNTKRDAKGNTVLTPIGRLVKGEVYPRVRDYGNWHRIQFGNRYGYVRKSGTAPADGQVIKNINNKYKSTKGNFQTLRNVTVYDNTSGKLVPFAVILKGEQHPIVSDYGNWYRVDVAGRIGYVRKKEVLTRSAFKASDRYFEVIADNVTVYDNTKRDENGEAVLTPIGRLVKGEVYPRVRDYGNWHRIQFGNRYGYVRKSDTVPSDGKSIKNLNTTYKQSKTVVEALQDVTVYDNTSGQLVPFAVILEGELHPIVNSYGANWYRVDVSGRIGYIRKKEVAQEKINYTNYAYTLDDMLNIQMRTEPQTDLYRNKNAFVSAGYVKLNSDDGTKGTVTASALNVREEPNASAWIYGTLKQGQTVTIVNTVNSGSSKWHEIKYTTWRNAKPDDTARYLSPNNYDRFQHLVLSQSTGAPASELNNILSGKGTLAGKGSAFIEAGQKHGLNEVYLISHALLETGNGNSTLAKGVYVDTVDGKKVPRKKVYNMFGIGAYDGCAVRCGSEYAYKQGWFTPEAAIVGGAKFIGERYVNHPSYNQDTLYKMRWNPGKPGTHQYATDIGWAVKQVSRIKSFYSQLSSYRLAFDLPRYKK